MSTIPLTRIPLPQLTALAAGVGGAAIVGAAAAAAPEAAVAGAAVAVIIAVSAARPAWGACFLLGMTPLIAGLQRGTILPLVRPYEALGLLVGLGVVTRVIFFGRKHDLRFTRLDAALLLMAVASSIVPLFVMKARGTDIQQEDLLYAFQLWKYYGVFLIMRFSIRTSKQVRAALIIIVLAALIVGVIAMLQSLRVGGVDAFIGTYFPPDTENSNAASEGRGTTTIGSSIAGADVTVYAFAVAAAWALTMRRRPPLMPLLAFGLVLGTLGSGQFTGFIGLAVAAFALGLVTRRLGRFALAFAPTLVLGVALLRPVIQKRLEPLQRGELPQSWEVRLQNLETFFWPVLGRDLNWITGVRPQARVLAPPGWPAGEWIYIESGITWLLWTGGLLFLVAFYWFLWVGLRTMWGIARSRAGEVSVAGHAGFVVLVTMGVLMLLDPHLSFRASSDLSFSLLGIAVGGATWQAASGGLAREALRPELRQVR